MTYKVFDENNSENKIDKNVEYGGMVYYIPALQIDGVINKRDEIIFPEFISTNQDPLLNTISNAAFIKKYFDPNKEETCHYTYPLNDKKRREETKYFFKKRAIEEYYFNDLFDFLNINNNNDFTLLVSLYNKIYNHKLIDIITHPVIDPSPIINKILKVSNGYLIFHHQLEWILKHLFQVSDSVAMTMRRNWNKKRADKIFIWKEIEFDQGRSLYDLLISKAILHAD